MTALATDQVTGHESAPYEAEVGRFSRGLEQMPLTPQKLHRGRFSEGLEHGVATRVGRFGDGQAVLDVRRPRVVRGTFAR